MKRFDIREEGRDSGKAKVTNLQADQSIELKEFDFQRLRKSGEGSYGMVRDKYGPLAATDPDRVAKSRKDARFSINPLLKAPLAIEEEERRVVEVMVRKEIERISEAARSEAARQGHEEGLRRGHEEAFKRWASEGKLRLEAFDEFLRSCEQAKNEIFKENERFLMELVFRIARMVLLRELKTDGEHVLRVAREVMERAGLRDHLRIRINPRDAETTELLREGLQKVLGKMENLNVEVSEAVVLGGCIVDTEWSSVDASVQMQLDNIYESLMAASPETKEG